MTKLNFWWADWFFQITKLLGRHQTRLTLVIGLFRILLDYRCANPLMWAFRFHMQHVRYMSRFGCLWSTSKLELSHICDWAYQPYNGWLHYNVTWHLGWILYIWQLIDFVESWMMMPISALGSKTTLRIQDNEGSNWKPSSKSSSNLHCGFPVLKVKLSQVVQWIDKAYLWNSSIKWREDKLDVQNLKDHGWR